LVIFPPAGEASVAGEEVSVASGGAALVAVEPVEAGSVVRV